MTTYTPTGKPDDVTRYDSRALRREFELVAEGVNSKSDAGSDSTVSATSMLIESPATKTFTAETGKDFAPGQTVYIARTADPANYNMTGTLVSYARDTTGIMQVSVTSKNGTGTFSDWTIGVSNQSGVTLVSNTFTGHQNFARATVASHATTADIWNSGGNQINFTGTAAVTDFPDAPQGGPERVLICAGACSFTASADMEIDGVQPGGVLQCAAKDIVLVRATSTTTFRLSVTRYTGDNGESNTVSSAVDITLTSASARLQVITMTAIDKKVTLPAATTLARGSPVYIIHNAGSYSFSLINGANGFVAELKPLQSVVLGCSDTSTSAGVWQTHGAEIDKLDKTSGATVINAVDSREIAVAALTSTSAICCFKNNATGKLNAVVLNDGAAPGSVLQLGSDDVFAVAVAAQTPTQATVAYFVSGALITKAYVLDIAGNVITPGTLKTVDNTATGSAVGNVALSVLSSTQLLCLYLTSTSALKEVVFTISASVISLSAAVTSSLTSVTSGYQLLTINAAKVLSSAAPVRLRLQSITAGVPAPVGSLLALDTFGGSDNAQFGMQLLSADRVLAAYPIAAKNCIVLTVVDVSGTTPAVLQTRAITAVLETGSVVTAARLTGLDKVYVAWVGESRGVNSMIVTVGADSKIHISPTSQYVDNTAAPGFGYVAACAMSATRVLNVCRNSSTYLSAKFIGVP